MTFTTHGSVRGSCGHAHRSLETACKCLRQDQRNCKSLGGYSDRDVVRNDGQQLDDSEQEYVYYYLTDH
jgi:hypothetical protein